MRRCPLLDSQEAPAYCWNHAMQEIELAQKELAAQGWEEPVQQAAAAFQPFKWKMDIITDTIAIGLVDDRYGHHILVLVAKIQVRALALVLT